MTPGTYLRKRREAAGLSLADVAARIATLPNIAQHVRAEWIALIERDEQPADFATVVALSVAYRFDMRVIVGLVEHALAPDRHPVFALCRTCAVNFTVFTPESVALAGLCTRCARAEVAA